MAYAQAGSILTEHLGYAPISLIDDVINAVNDILYKCTAAMESFLTSRYGEDERIAENEIEHGTAQLEMVLESVVDKSFDKFELYVLRNLLTIPVDLISGGWIRLKHHQGVDFSGPTAGEPLIEDQIAAVEKELYIQRRMNNALSCQLKSKQLALERISDIQRDAEFLSPQNNSLLLGVHPLSETVSKLCGQARNAVDTMKQTEESLNSIPLKPYLDLSPRDRYINNFAHRAIQEKQIPLTVQGPHVGAPEDIASVARLVKTAGL